MKPLTAILFDLDGTLIDSREDITASVNEVRGLCELPAYSVEAVSKMVGLGIRVLLGKALGENSSLPMDEAVAKFREHYEEHCLDRTRLYDGVEQTLDALSAYSMGVVSNKPERFCRMILDGLGVAGRFGVILGGDSTSEKKPHPEPVYKAMISLGAKPPGVILVGDSPVDVTAGRQAGVRTCAVTYGLVEKEALREAGPNHLIDSITELPALIAGVYGEAEGSLR
ncbi:MAG: HAD-IA family hydrolase [Planctomycetota bacterium]|nr:HAD-IA family hydrolase [Planctomycetota bacterium]